MEPDAETTEGLSLGSTEAVGAQMRGVSGLSISV